MSKADLEECTESRPNYGATDTMALDEEMFADAAPAASTQGRLATFLHKGEPEDPMTYHTHRLAAWESLSVLNMTVWGRRSLWMTALRLFGFSMVVAVILMLSVGDPVDLNVEAFTKITQFLNTFVSILLGFFMSASVQRWWGCVDAFQATFESIRVLQMQLYGLGVAEEKADECLRYSVLAAWILSGQLRIEALDGQEEREIANDEMWQALKSGVEKNGRRLDTTWLTISEDELTCLYDCHDAPIVMWIWVTSFIGRLAVDGDIPLMGSPTYCRVMGIVEAGQAGMRKVRSSITMQAPFIYVQMLASLVHINNIINSLSFGMTLGSSMGTIIQHYHHPKEVSGKAAMQDGQMILVSFFFSCFGPFIYQALLEVSIAIAQPFGSPDGSIPTWRMMRSLQKDLHDGKKLLHHTYWKTPCFKSSS